MTVTTDSTDIKKKRRPKRRLDLLPRFISISDAVRYGGCGRTKIYEFGARYPGLIKKNGAASVVDLPIFDEILDALPEAQIKPTGHR